MKRIGIAIAATAALVLGGAGVAGAQAGEITVEVDRGEVEPDGEVNVTTSGMEPNGEATVTLGEREITKTADADGVATGTIQAPTEPGSYDGIVTVNGQEVPFSVVVAAAAAGGGGDAGGGGGDAGAGGGGGQELPRSGLDDTGMLAALGAALLGAGTMLVLFSRRNSITR